MIKIEIDQELLLAKSGVYLITFSSGHFYIGSSKDLAWRINKHRQDILGGFIHCVKSLCPMRGFNGTVFFSLIESIPVEHKMYGLPKTLLEAELRHIRSYKSNKFMLNDIKKAGTRTTVSASIDNDVKKWLINEAKRKKCTIGSIIEDILTNEYTQRGNN